MLLLVLPLLLWRQPHSFPQLMVLVHWPTLVALAGLMIVSRGLEDSGLLSLMARQLLLRFGTVRSLALSLVLFSAMLSAIVTNDVALFIVVPLTLALRQLADLPVGRLIVFEALAVNGGSTLSPVGNPQNLFLWQHSGMNLGAFLLMMTPLALAVILVLLLMLPLAFARGELHLKPQLAAAAIKRPLCIVSLCCYPLFLLALEWGLGARAFGLVLLLYALRFPRVLRYVDWPLLLVFALMFIDLRLLAQLPESKELVRQLLTLPGGDLSAAVLLSQLMSNVPATILLSEFTGEVRALAYGVSVGGFGLAVGSLANLIALRLSGQPGLWRDFHRWSLPLLVLSWILALLINQGVGIGANLA